MKRVFRCLGVIAGSTLACGGVARASELVAVEVLDQDYLVVHFRDGQITHDESVVGEWQEVVERYTPELDTGAATDPTSFTITSDDDDNYAGGANPDACYRKTKLNGHAQLDWVASDYEYEYTYDHFIYLKLPSALQDGSSYTISIDGATNSSSSEEQLTFDVFTSRSEALHVNLVGYLTDTSNKAADLYYWMGDGGARDYSSFEGNEVLLYDVVNQTSTAVGTVTFGAAEAAEDHGHNYTRSPVWNVDWSELTDPGTYRLVVEGVGSSQDFIVGDDAYLDPFRVAVRGFFYMRLGDTNPSGVSPPPRSPTFIPEVDPQGTQVVITTMHPFHDEWDSLGCGDCWDAPDAWAPYAKAQNPTNPDAWGGYADAADLDRHLGHVPIVWDLLLPYILTQGAIDDDDLGITESGNEIPDLVDSAAWETDFWLRLRDPDDGSYSHGLTNPNGSDTIYQAGGTAISAWANAVNAAMLAEAFRIAGRTSEMESYRDAAIEAYEWAAGQSDPMLDTDSGLAWMRGRDLQMTAAAYLYNVTGDTAYEDVVAAESSAANDSSAALAAEGSLNQVWATAGYLMTPQTVNYPALQDNMRSSILAEAMALEADNMEDRPSRRTSDGTSLWFQTTVDVNRSIVAHAVAESDADRDYLLQALSLEADWTLGRNPLNIIQMSTPSSVLSSKRNMDQVYYWVGLEDGVAGMVPGLTPYVNLELWGDCGLTMSCPPRLYENGYPADAPNEWPLAEAYFPSSWVYVHTEFTPQQTMRGKAALYAYLHGLAGDEAENPEPVLSVTKDGSGEGTVTSEPAGIDCGDSCSAAFASGTEVTLTATPQGQDQFAGWSGACTGTDATCTVALSSAPQLVTATFESEVSGGGSGGSGGAGENSNASASGGNASGSGGSTGSGNSNGSGGASSGSGTNGGSGTPGKAGTDSDSGCGCSFSRRDASPSLFLGAFFALLFGRRRRTRLA